MQEPGKLLSKKLRSYFRPKCILPLLDGEINSSGVVRLNVYQVNF